MHRDRLEANQQVIFPMYLITPIRDDKSNDRSDDKNDDKDEDEDDRSDGDRSDGNNNDDDDDRSNDDEDNEGEVDYSHRKNSQQNTGKNRRSLYGNPRDTGHLMFTKTCASSFSLSYFEQQVPRHSRGRIREMSKVIHMLRGPAILSDALSGHMQSSAPGPRTHNTICEQGIKSRYPTCDAPPPDL